VIHDPSDGVLCWGGPEHERVVPIEASATTVEFPIQRRLTSADAALDPVSPYISTVRYQVHRWGVRWGEDTTEEWRVLIYGDGEERLLKNFTGTVRLIQWMAEPWGWILPEEAAMATMRGEH
jgi:hypothetical protein